MRLDAAAAPICGGLPWRCPGRDRRSSAGHHHGDLERCRGRPIRATATEAQPRRLLHVGLDRANGFDDQLDSGRQSLRRRRLRRAAIQYGGRWRAYHFVGGTATLPAGFTLRDGETAIFAEVIYDYKPFVVPDLIGNTILRHRASFRPRFGALSALSPGAVPPGAPTCT